jgi:hypothetical protein
VIDGSPLKVAEVLTCSKLSSTLATSRSRTGLPPFTLTISSAYSAALLICLLAVSVSVWRGPSSVPSGVLVLDAASAVRSSSIVMLRAASADGITRTRTA